MGKVVSKPEKNVILNRKKKSCLQGKKGKNKKYSFKKRGKKLGGSVL